MFKIQKKPITVEAYQLGSNEPSLEELMAKGLLIKIDDTHYEVFSQETKTKGEIAEVGDYIKCDASDRPYPNTKDYFLSHFDHIEGHLYRSQPVVFDAWDLNEPMCEEISYLKAHKGLIINDDGFRAPLWGTIEHAQSDAVIIFYKIERQDDQIIDIDFNFVARKEFKRLYQTINS